MSDFTGKRIGIFSGSFDPVHKGHIAFALKALEIAKLDEVYFAPEIKPRRRDHVVHFAHRVSMIELAIRVHPKLKILQLPDRNFSAKTTVPRLQKIFRGADLVYILGSDLFLHLPTWLNIDFLLKNMELVVGVRSDQSINEARQIASQLPASPKSDPNIFISPESKISAGQIRQQLNQNLQPKEILASVQDYITKHWLYHDIKKASKNL